MTVHSDRLCPVFEQNLASWTKQSLFGGKGEVTVADLLGNAKAAPFEAVLGCRLEAGGHVGAHHQESADEVVIVVAGNAIVKVAGKPHQLSSGGCVYLAKGQLLEIENASPIDPVDYLIVKASRK